MMTSNLRCLVGLAFLVSPGAGAATLQVGPGETYTTVSAAVAAASPGDTIAVQAGTYVNDFPIVNIPLTIDSVGGTAVLEATESLPSEAGILIANSTITINGLEFEGASIPDALGGNGAGIRYQSGQLTVLNSIFANNEDGLLANPDPSGVIVIDNSTFNDNGSGTGLTHALYANMIDSLTVENSSFNGTQVGHDIKSRAANTFVFDNYLDDGVTGTTSYAVDIPNGGNATISGNDIVQGPATQNSAMIAYGEEGEIYASNSLLVTDNIFSNSRPNAVGVFNHTSDVDALLEGNVFIDVSQPLVGPGTITDSVPEPGPSYLAGLALAVIGIARRSRQVIVPAVASLRSRSAPRSPA